jgi:hypothetical protein
MKKIFAAAALALALPLTVMAQPVSEYTVPAEQSMSGRAVHVTLDMISGNEIKLTTNEGYSSRAVPCAAFAKSALRHSRLSSNVVEIIEEKPALGFMAQTMREALAADSKAMEACQSSSTPSPAAEYTQAKNEISAVQKRIDAVLKP